MPAQAHAGRRATPESESAAARPTVRGRADRRIADRTFESRRSPGRTRRTRSNPRQQLPRRSGSRGPAACLTGRRPGPASRPLHGLRRRRAGPAHAHHRPRRERRRTNRRTGRRGHSGTRMRDRTPSCHPPSAESTRTRTAHRGTPTRHRGRASRRRSGSGSQPAPLHRTAGDPMTMETTSRTKNRPMTRARAPKSRGRVVCTDGPPTTRTGLPPGHRSQ